MKIAKNKAFCKHKQLSFNFERQKHTTLRTTRGGKYIQNRCGVSSWLANTIAEQAGIGVNDGL